MMDKKRTSAYYSGYTDGAHGTPPDYSQSSWERFQDYRDGYRAGKAARVKAKQPEMEEV